jgi:hypothetical protein
MKQPTVNTSIQMPLFTQATTDSTVPTRNAPTYGMTLPIPLMTASGRKYGTPITARKMPAKSAFVTTRSSIPPM